MTTSNETIKTHRRRCENFTAVRTGVTCRSINIVGQCFGQNFGIALCHRQRNRWRSLEHRRPLCIFVWLQTGQCECRHSFHAESFVFPCQLYIGQIDFLMHTLDGDIVESLCGLFQLLEEIADMRAVFRWLGYVHVEWTVDSRYRIQADDKFGTLQKWTDQWRDGRLRADMRYARLLIIITWIDAFSSKLVSSHFFTPWKLSKVPDSEIRKSKRYFGAAPTELWILLNASISVSSTATSVLLSWSCEIAIQIIKSKFVSNTFVQHSIAYINQSEIV